MERPCLEIAVRQSPLDNAAQPANFRSMVLIRSVMAVSLVFGCRLVAHGAIDGNGNGMCDIWEARYASGALAPEADPDGDGQNNRSEAIAGTDPQNAADSLRVATVAVSGTVDLGVPAQPGKRYQLWSAPELAGPWAAVGPPVTGTTASLAFNGGAPNTGQQFFRVTAEDVDSDGDGLSDWAERQLAGFDPQLGDSFGTGSPQGDFGIATTWLAALANGGLTVTPVAADAYEKEGTPARVTFTRSTAHDQPFTVFLRRAAASGPGVGAAGAGDFLLQDGAGAAVVERLIIPAGQPSAELVVRPVADSAVEVPEEARWNVGGSSLIAAMRVCDAAPVAANLRLLVAYLSPRPGVASLGSGLVSIRLAGDNSAGTVTVGFSNLRSPANSAQILTAGGATLVSVPASQYGGYVWPIRASQYFTTDQAVLDALLTGDFSFIVFTETSATGEIGGAFQAVTGSTEFQEPPPAPPVLALAGAELDREIARFLTQASFGPTLAEIAALRSRVASHGGDRIAAFGAWIDEQFTLPSPSHESLTRAGNTQELTIYSDPTKTYYNASFDPNQSNRRRAWWTIALGAPDQLRQRLAFALSEIFVVSEEDAQLYERAYGVASYYDMLKDRGTGPYRTLLEGVSLHPVMGHYLSHLRNQKQVVNSSGVVLVSPDENYAREIMQLFSIGLVRLHPDGSLVLGADGLPLPTYSQDDITELARVFTGWSFSVYNSPTNSDTVVPNTDFNRGAGTERFEARWTNPMKQFASYHDTGAKTYLGLSVPAGLTGEQDLARALDHLAAHPNTAPFIVRRLIQRFTTANPSAGYLYRVATAFTASAGNLGATVKAILLDPEARDPGLALSGAGHGRAKEPLLRHTALLRALGARAELRLSDLAAYGYPAEELAKFPADARIARYSNTTADLVQMPLDAPSVFNWFRPDFSPAGPLAENGISSPEFQIANETTVVKAINYHYVPIYTSTGQSPGSLPNYAEVGYTSTSDNLIMDFAPLQAAYLAVVDGNQDGVFNNLDTATFNNAASIAAAVEQVVDQLDLLLCAGAMKARHGNAPGTPRKVLLDAVNSIRASSNSSTTGQATSMNDRIKAALYLMVKSPDFVVHK
jgi:uncharacterized protein (DUF1800 family)